MSVRTWFPRVLGGIGLTLMALSTLHAQIPHVAERLPSIFDEAAADGGSGEGDEGGEANVADSLKSLDERLKKLEKSGKDVEGIKKDLGTLTDEFDEFSGDKSIAHSGSSKSTMKISGRIHVDAWGFPSNSPQIDQLEGGPEGPQARLNFRRMRFGVAGNLPSNMLYKIEMEFAGGVDSEFRDAYLGWKDLPIFQQVLIGNQKRPYGLDHLNSSRYNVFLERPFVIEAFNQDSRRLGIQSYGVSENERWNWRYGVFNQRLIQDEGNYTNDHLQLEFASRLANTFWWDETSEGRGYAHWAISHSWAHPDGRGMGDTNPSGTGPDQDETRFRTRPEARTATRWLDTERIAGVGDYHLLGLENVWNFGPVQFVGEYQNMWLLRDAGAGSDLFLWGGYFYASYFLTGEHMPWSRSSGTLERIKPFEEFFLVRRARGGCGGGWGAWQIAARYSYLDLNDGVYGGISDGTAGGIGESFTFGLNWYWTAYARMQFNWMVGEIRDNIETRDVPLSGSYSIVGSRFMVDF
ncbi:MAG: ATPase [Planctomycetales bacterium]|nr:ATPase [Planctomycetales bacterium]